MLALALLNHFDIIHRLWAKTMAYTCALKAHKMLSANQHHQAPWPWTLQHRPMARANSHQPSNNAHQQRLTSQRHAELSRLRWARLPDHLRFYPNRRRPGESPWRQLRRLMVATRRRAVTRRRQAINSYDANWWRILIWNRSQYKPTYMYMIIVCTH